MSLAGVYYQFGRRVSGGLIGSFCKKGIPEKVRSTLMTGLGLCVLYIGVSGVLSGGVMILICPFAGRRAGELIDIDGKLLALAGRFRRSSLF
jgi:uncharacterized membrane protein YqgA involved in biofilm formation